MVGLLLAAPRDANDDAGKRSADSVSGDLRGPVLVRGDHQCREVRARDVSLRAEIAGLVQLVKHPRGRLQ